ncbi:CLUMA_CG012704, isoform A [Clunio marinus]|uniref:Mediator of RNA polymerase II transcription subunit 24 n=1 Tax=Clunio marinus TaxID=568069 RepID=A0A1J1II39_9DIPT|nr:CLUMA_CG012704, isoform A [Clunio marinus]
MDVRSRQQAISKVLMKAWRERWTEYEFGIQIKQCFPSVRLIADANNLTDVIMEQSLIGAGVNKLLLSYLKHSLHSQLISYPAVVMRITKYTNYERYNCIKALLDFLLDIIDGVTCRSKAEESALMSALLSLVFWLIEMTEKLVKHVELNNGPTKEQEHCLEKITTLSHSIIKNKFLMGVLYLAKLEDRELYDKCIINYKRIHNMSKYEVVKIFYQMIFVKLDHMAMKELEQRVVEPITFCLQPFMSIEVLVHSSADTSVHVSKFLMIQKLKRYSTSRLYCEIIRSCFITLCHVKEVNYRIWGAFFLFKLPLILKQIHLQTKTSDDKMDFSEDVIKAFEMLMECTPIVDLMDTTFQCNSIECFLVELMKHNLISEDNFKKIVDKREIAISKLEKFDIPSTPPPINQFVSTIEPTLNGFISSLRDQVMPEVPVLQMFCTLLVENRAFLLYSVASVKAQHKTMINGIVKVNDKSKEILGEASKSKQAVTFYANMFDMSFILLFSIMQKSGCENFPEMTGDYFFEKWCREGMAFPYKSKSPMSIVKMCDQTKVEEMIAYFSDTTTAQSSTISFKWGEICINIPAMLHNVLIAWENETITTVRVKNILDNMRTKMCCFAVIAASWLCSYVKVLREDEQAKPKFMVQQLMKPVDENTMKLETFSEKLSLTHEIIMKLYDSRNSAEILYSQKPLNETFCELWKEISAKRWLPFEVAINLEQLFKSCGAFWLMKNLIEQIFKCKFIKEMETTMDIVFAVMHLNIEACTETLLRDILPIMLLNKSHCSKLKGLQSRMLAKLCVYAILSTMDTADVNRKRPRDDDDDMNSMTKVRKTGIEQQSIGSGIEGSSNDKDISSQLRESLKMSLQDLFKIFYQQVTKDEMSPKVDFIFQFLSLLVQLEKSVKLKSILKLIPNGLIMNLLKIIPEDDVSFGFVLRLYDLSVSSGRALAISELCLLRNIQIRKNSIKL